MPAVSLRRPAERLAVTHSCVSTAYIASVWFVVDTGLWVFGVEMFDEI